MSMTHDAGTPPGGAPAAGAPPAAGAAGSPPAGTAPAAGAPPAAGGTPPAAGGTPPAAGAPPAAGTPPAGATPAAGTPPAEAKPPAGADQFWRDHVAPEFKAQAERFASLNDVFKSNNDLRTDNSQRIKVPGPDASDEDKAKFRKALGIPDKPEGYEIKPPEGIEMSDADKKLLEVMLPIAHEAGVPQSAMQGFTAKFMEFSRDLQNQAVEQIKAFGTESETALKKEWGRDFDANVGLANRVAEKVGGPEFKKLLNETPLVGSGMLGDHPLVVKFLANIGRSMGESDMQIGVSPEARQTAQAELNELNRSVPVGSPTYLTKEHQDKVRALFERIHGGAPIVGSSGRAA